MSSERIHLLTLLWSPPCSSPAVPCWRLRKPADRHRRYFGFTHARPYRWSVALAGESRLPTRVSRPVPSALDTTGTGGSRPGCAPSLGNPSGATGGNPPDATPGIRTPRIINDPTVGTSQTAETGPIPNTVIPKDPKTGRRGDC